MTVTNRIALNDWRARRAPIAQWALTVSAAMVLAVCPAAGQAHARRYLGIDRNRYPGDAVMQQMRRSVAFTGYWLNTPPGAESNEWTGRRAVLAKQGWGFLILWNGRKDAELKDRDVAHMGSDDGRAAAEAAKREGFPAKAIVFVDQEEGGRLLPEQAAYLEAWVEAVRRAGYRAGVYCSGMEAPDGPGKTITTASDVQARDPKIALFVYNDACPPSPGGTAPRVLPAPRQSGTASAAVWQFSQSPRRAAYTAQCADSYAEDGNSYPPGVAHGPGTYVDLDVAESADPSRGR